MIWPAAFFFADIYSSRCFRRHYHLLTPLRRADYAAATPPPADFATLYADSHIEHTDISTLFSA